MKKKIAGLTVALGVAAAGVITFGVTRSTPVSAEPMENICICHATQQNKVEGNTEQAPNDNQKFILICPNGNSSQRIQGHADHPDDIFVPEGDLCVEPGD